MRQCAKAELFSLGFGELPQACHLSSLGGPSRYLWLIPGWPNDFLRKSAAAHVPFYVIEADSVAEAKRLAQLPISGIITNRIEVIGDCATESSGPKLIKIKSEISAHGCPKDGYLASGALGERIYVVPSEHLVVARFGYTTGRNFGRYPHVGLIAAVISALNR